MRRLAAMAAALTAAGCVHTRGRPITQQQIDQLRPGETTMAEAQGIFGPPMSVTRDHGRGITSLSWHYGRAGPFGSNAQGGFLMLVFGAEGKLVPICKGTKAECAAEPSPIHSSTVVLPPAEVR